MSAHAWVERAIAPKSKNNRPTLYAYLPEDQEQAKNWLRQVLGTRVRLRPVRRHGLAAWQLSPRHLLTLTGELAYAYGTAEMRVEFVPTSLCTSQCEDAKIPVWECVCRCAGEFHGGRGSRVSWYPTQPRTRLSRNERTQTDQLIVTAGQLEAVKKIPRPAAPVVVEQPPLEPPRHTAPQRDPVSPGPQAPRTVIPAAARFGDSQQTSATTGPPAPSPAHRRTRQVPVSVRTPVAAPLIAAVLLIAAVVGGVWLAVQPDHPDTRHSTNSETSEPAEIPAELAPPPVAAAEPAPTPAPRFPAGCFPFQADC
ncbi:hypothetical protein OG225_41165 (plasmid) [Nocardia sp. NBC_01377]|uniref:hypothetical protein n=1 Tax=Nocardia sp. NBC_01377 TaxID=2903595 RepID=UPI002F91474B